MRDRPDDVLLLVEHFLAEARTRSGKTVRGFNQAALKVLCAYGWPGNVRELENVVERAVALAETAELSVLDLPPQVRDRRPTDLLDGALARRLTLAELEREYIQRVMQAEGGNKTRAAQRLGLDRKTLYRKLDETDGSSRGVEESPPAEDEAAAPRRTESTARIQRNPVPEGSADD